jgi:hypothetical protein
LKWLGLALVALIGACSSSPSTTSPTGPTSPPSGPATILAAGDIAWCDDLRAAEQTAKILDQQPGTVLALGDLAYMQGTFEQFRNCYTPTWGRHRGRTRPVPGNHDYDTAGAGPYFEYFGERAGGSGDGYYAFTAGSWEMIALNSNIPMDRGSPQYIWLQRELQKPSRCTLAYWHHPRFTSGPNGDNPHTGPIWELLYAAGVDVILNGHDHIYERFLPMNPNGQLDRDRGMRQFTSGGGGAALYKLASVKPNSAARLEGYGVLKLVLGDGRYDWEYLPVAAGFSDTGFDTCH